MTVLLLLFCICVFLILHSYVLYPWLIRLLAKGKSMNQTVYSRKDELPHVYLLIAAYNEESIIGEKIESIISSDYPKDKLHIYVGSDGSSDNTDSIVKDLAKVYSAIHFYRYEDRGGKANVLNRLHQELPDLKKDDVFVFTDANIIFEKDTLFEMVKHFKNEEVGQVGANVQNKGMRRDGISQQEQFYISRENRIKYHEGLIWGSMMGAFGACYALRGSLFPTIPKNFLMEDFYISMHVLKKNYRAILEPSSQCWEDLPNEVQEEFKRKIRISAGNFQNLSVYYSMIWAPKFGTAFAFFSHKIIRWITPFLLLILLSTSAVLAFEYDVFKLLLGIQLLLMLSPILDNVVKRIHIHSLLLRFVSYFYAMNMALLVGFFKYLNGVKTSVWQPTKRVTDEIK